MLIFYVDESGNTHPHHEPLLDGESPLFCLSAVALRASDWRAYDRDLLSLKRRYYRRDMEQYAAAKPGRRPEQHEIKGTDLLKPSHAQQRRPKVFVQRVLELCQAHNARCFAAIWHKNAKTPTAPDSIYNMSLQVLAGRFHLYCEDLNEQGIVVVDSRTHGLNLQVATSHLSYVFGHDTGRDLTRLIEAPMFADSTLSAGLQIADVVGKCLYGCFYQRHFPRLRGRYIGSRLCSPAEMAAGAFTHLRTPAYDYSHCNNYWPALDGFEWVRAVRTGILPTVIAGYTVLP